MHENKKDSKEGFCGACLAVPLAMAGVGVGAAGATAKGSQKKTRKMLIWTGVITVILSLLIAVYYMFIKKCQSCTLK